MSCCDEFFSSLPREKDRQYAYDVHSPIWDILGELERIKCLRSELRGNVERTDFTKILKSSNEIFKAFNMYFDIFLTKGRSKEFVKHNKEFGFYPDGAVHLLFSDTIFIFLMNVELFRSSFLMTLRMNRCFKENMTIGRFLNQLVRLTGKIGENIKKEIDVQLRNALAHGLFWIDRLALYYYKDVSLKKKKEIRYDRLSEKAIRQSIMTQVLICSIADWFAATV